MRLSIIIPAYKVDGFIEKCIRSLEDQDIPKSDFEIIVTNDGSPDRSREIVESLQKEFSNLIVINQENQGVSMARNNAIAIAKGKYILPIDPDDYVVANSFSHILDHADSLQADVMYLGFEIFDADQKSVWQTDYSTQKKVIFNGVEGYFAARGSEIRDPDRSWGMLYNKALLDKFGITYPKDVPYLEDGLFLAKVFAVAEKVGFDNTMFYQRTTRKGSATNSRLFYSEKAIQGFINAILDIKSFDAANKFGQQQKLLIHHVVAKFTLLPLTSFIGQKNLKDYFAFIRKLKQLDLNKINTEGLRLGYQKMAAIYNFSATLFFVHYLVDSKVKNYRK